jgi:hypothetical protein
MKAEQAKKPAGSGKKANAEEMEEESEQQGPKHSRKKRNTGNSD